MWLHLPFLRFLHITMENSADRIPAQVDTPGSADASTVNHYQRRLLYGGGMVISIILAVATGLLLYSMARDEIARRYTDFAIRKLLVQLEFQAREFAVRTFIAHEEAVWPEREPASPALIASFAAQHGRIVLQGNRQFDPVLALGDITPGHPAASFGRYLALANELSYRAGAYFKLQAQSQAMSGYLYSPDHTFIVFIPAPDPNSALQTHAGADVRQLVGTIAPDDAAFHQLAHTPAGLRASWLAPVLDPIQKQQVIRLVATAFDNGEPFATLISNLPTRSLLARLPMDQYDTVSFIVDGTGRVIVRSDKRPSAQGMLDLAMRAHPALGSTKLNSVLRHGRFILSQGIQGTGWTMVHTFSWRTIIVALWPKMVACAATLLFVIGLIWWALRWLDHKVFVPAAQRSQRIMESENLNRTMITTAPFGFALMGLHNRAVLLQNDVMRAYAARMQGGEPLHRKLLGLLDPDPAAPAWQHDLEAAVAMQDGSTCDLLVSLMRTRYQGNDVVLCNFTDITARKNTERKLEEARRAADAANEAKSVFLATMSHEIRTPLNAILGNLELLDRSPLKPEQSERLHTVTTSSHALLDTISSVLDFSKIESGQMPIEIIRFDLADLIRQVGAMFAPIVEAKGIQFDCVVDDALAAHYMGDPTRIRQIVTNLLSNAVKFTAQGDITLEVYLRNDADPQSPIVIGVSDSGVGMTPAQQQQLFHPFAQADSSIARRFGGTGLGLALCRRLAELMHGTIGVKSEIGVGSTFIVTLPLPVATAPDAGDVDTREQSLAAHAQPVRILVVDDHPANRALVQAQMNTLGYQADVAADGAQALQLIAQARYDMVLTDLNMPGMDGYTLARLLRSQGMRLPIIAVTASASVTEHERCAEAGMNAVLVRPILLDTIEHMVRELAGSSAEPHAITHLAEGPLPANIHALLQQSLRQSVDAIHASLGAGDLKSVRDHLHALRGSFAMIGEMETADKVGNMEAMAVAGDRAALAVAMREFAAHAPSVLHRRAKMPS